MDENIFAKGSFALNLSLCTIRYNIDKIKESIESGSCGEIGEYLEKIRASSGFLERENVSLRERNFDLEKLSNLDHLTGINNRRSFEHHFENVYSFARRSGSPLSFLLIDVDRFKGVNDEYGHEVGDNILKYLADELISSVRSSDIVSRWGGEEFSILLPNTDIRGAREVGFKVNSRVKENSERVLDKGITVSIGACEVDTSKHCYYDALKNSCASADSALYYVKNNGRDGFAYDFGGKIVKG